MNGRRRTWGVFAAVAGLILGAAALLTHASIEAERRRAADESLRQALWRLDARAAELLLSAAVGSADRGWQVRPGDHARAYLEVDTDGRVVAASGKWAGDRLPAALAQLAAGLGAPAEDAPDEPARMADELRQEVQQNAYGMRASNARRLQQTVQQALDAPSDPAGPVAARWIGDQLVLARRVLRAPGVQHVQAAILDWPRLRREFAAAIADLLPDAAIEAAPAGEPGADRLAALPARIVVGRVPAALPSGLRSLLGGAWAALIAGLAVAGGALWAAHRLAERRATFVSAVTHELRTPLTALRLHADLVADPRIGGDPARRDAAAQVLRGEAARLARLVDNVLDYARLERRRPPSPGRHDLAALLAPLLPALAARLGEAGIALAADPPPSVAVRCDPDAVGRILVNLADNAAKYGAGPVRLSVAVAAGRAAVRLRDHGPGIPAELRPRLFVPFARSAEAAAGSAPGVGLGLALCRRLARAQGGELAIAAADDGAGTVATLLLPLA